MLQWNDLHPYSAVHVVRVPEALDLPRLQQAVAGTLESRGLTNLTFDRGRNHFEYHGGAAAIAIKTVAGGGDPFAALSAEIEQQLNTAFSLGEGASPFRFFVVAENDAYFLGVVYLHAVADAESLVHLLKHIVGMSTGRIEPATAAARDHVNGGDNLRPLPPGLLPRKLAALPSLVRKMRNSCRPHFRDSQDLHNGFTLFSLPGGSMPGLIEAAKSSGVTLNDLLLALLLKSLAPLSANRVQSQKRRNISLGTIVNVRKDLGLEGPQIFGLFLGSFIITHSVPEKISIQDLAKDIRVQTLPIKLNKLYLGTPLELAVGRGAAALFSTERRKKFYQKHYPLWGGITNMNLNSIWDQREADRPVDYFRAVSTGPVTPLVLSVTTVRNAVNIGLTYRSTVFSADQIEAVKNVFVGWESQLGGPA